MKTIFLILFMFMFQALAQSKPGDGTLPVLNSIKITMLQGPLHMPKEINIQVNQPLSKEQMVVKKYKAGSEIETITVFINQRDEVDIKIAPEKPVNQFFQIRPLSQDSFLSKSKVGVSELEREIVLMWK